MKKVKLEPMPKAKVVKKTTSKTKRKYPTHVEVMPKGKMPKMPGGDNNPPAVHYLQGVIYTVAKEKKFRGLKIRGNPYTETSASWKQVGMKEAWGKVNKAFEKKLGIRAGACNHQQLTVIACVNKLKNSSSSSSTVARVNKLKTHANQFYCCLLYTSPSPRD